MTTAHAYHPSLLPALALVATLAACSPNSTGSPNPSSSPGTTPEPSGTPGVGIEHETGATDVVLRFEEGGGFVPMGFLAGQAPTFTLYGDGTIIFRDWSQQQPPVIGGAMPQLPFQTVKLTGDEIQQLLEFMIGPGALGIARAAYDPGNVADAPTAVFTINAGGITKTVSVVALGFENPQSPDALILTQLAAAGTRLREFKAANAAIWQPERYRGVLSTDAFGAPRDWPWPDLAPGDWHDITTPNGFTWNARTMTAAEIDALGMEDIEGGVINVVLNGPGDGNVYSFTLRPLLPDEEA